MDVDGLAGMGSPGSQIRWALVEWGLGDEGKAGS